MPLPSVQDLRGRECFLQRISHETPFYRLFDCLPEVAFFAKSRDFRLMCASQRFLDRFGFREEAEVIGKDDFELFPPRLAESFRRDDEEVFRTGEPKACEMLQREDSQIGEVAKAFGFCSQSSFTELFQKYVGITPLKFQRGHQLRRR